MKQCRECKTTFTPKFNNSQYCSSMCKDLKEKSKKQLIEEKYTDCLFCGNSFNKNRTKRKYCSVICRVSNTNKNRNLNKVKVDLKEKICIICKDTYKPIKSNQKTCSHDCRQNHNRIKNRQWCNDNYKNNITYSIKVKLRSRLRNAMYSNTKAGSAVSDLGCSIEELKTHLEVQFQKGMTWDNYGEWHIDHIKPLDAFDLTNPDELKEACHYTNLQPLWATENLSKGATYAT